MKLEVLWQQMVGIGAEHLMLDLDGAIHANSLAVGEIDSMAYRIRYEIDCDASWNVQNFRVEDLLTGKMVALTRGVKDQWTDTAGRSLPDLAGATDVDIMITPFTNTLPIRRLGLKVEEVREIAVVYVGLPGLAVSQMRQRYTCLSSDQDGGMYRYENLGSRFRADLKLDTDGLVVEYPNIFVMNAKRRLPAV